MPRPCGPCGDKRRYEIDRRLLEMDVTGETFRLLSSVYGYSEKALSRHKRNHLTVDLAEAKKAIDEAKAEAKEKELEEARTKTINELQTRAAGTMAERMELAISHIDRLREVQKTAADLLDKSIKAADSSVYGAPVQYLRELREQIKLWAELDKTIASQPQMNILISAEWIELRTLIIKALEPFPEAKEAVVDAITK